MIVVGAVVPDKVPHALWSRIEAVLDPAEQARAARFIAARHRHEFIAAHALKRIMLSHAEPSVAPSTWSFVIGPHGKPALAGRSDLHFNLSHCDGLVACATRRSGPVGVDLERLDRHVPLDIAEHYFAPEERNWLVAQPENARPAAFLNLWTLKEAVIKASGMGLALELDRFAVSVKPPKLSVTNASLGDLATWRLDQRVLCDKHLLALAWKEEALEEQLDVAVFPVEVLVSG